MKVNEKEINELMKRHNLTKDKATQLWLEDNGIIENAEIEEMTKKAKENVKRYEKNTSKQRKKSTKERKVDTEKGQILEVVKNALIENNINVTGQKTETEIYFEINNVNFTLKLTRHKNKEKG